MTSSSVVLHISSERTNNRTRTTGWQHSASLQTAPLRLSCFVSFVWRRLFLCQKRKLLFGAMGVRTSWVTSLQLAWVKQAMYKWTDERQGQKNWQQNKNSDEFILYQLLTGWYVWKEGVARLGNVRNDACVARWLMWTVRPDQCIHSRQNLGSTDQLATFSSPEVKRIKKAEYTEKSAQM